MTLRNRLGAPVAEMWCVAVDRVVIPRDWDLDFSLAELHARVARMLHWPGITAVPGRAVGDYVSRSVPPASQSPANTWISEIVYIKIGGIPLKRNTVLNSKRIYHTLNIGFSCL